MYLAFFLVAATSAAAPADADVAWRYDGATVSITVESQMRLRPLRHGISVRPSGRLPSDLDNPGGSLIFGNPARVRLRLIRSFNAACLAIRPGPSPQESPCAPSAVTRAPHGHACGSHMLVPRRSPTAILTASSSSRSPHVVTGVHGLEGSCMRSCGCPE